MARKYEKVPLPDLIPTHMEILTYPQIIATDSDWRRVTLKPYTLCVWITSPITAAYRLDIAFSEERRDQDNFTIETDIGSGTSGRPLKQRFNSNEFFFRRNSTESAALDVNVIIGYITEEEYKKYVEPMMRGR